MPKTILFTSPHLKKERQKELNLWSRMFEVGLATRSHLEGLKGCSIAPSPFSFIAKTERYLVVSNTDTKCVLSFSFQFHSFVYYYYGSVNLFCRYAFITLHFRLAETVMLTMLSISH
jgi:hypothetical protein